MTKYYYSATTNSFYPKSLQPEYDKAGSWPDDAIAVSDDVYEGFQTPPEGKVRAAGSDGLPVWVDTPAQTKEQLLAIAKSELASRMAEATAAIAPLQDAVDIDEATDEELANLKAWKKYRVALSRLDLSSAPDINWPVSPTS